MSTVDRPPTPRQEAVLGYVTTRIRDEGIPPTVREIGKEFGIQSPNGVLCHLKALEKRGLITRDTNMSRSIRICGPRREVMIAEMVETLPRNGLEAVVEMIDAKTLKRLWRCLEVHPDASRLRPRKPR